MCVVAAAGVVAALAYGSLVPFDLAWPRTFAPLAWLPLLRPPWPPASRTDVFVNIATGIPLGFFLTGAVAPVDARMPLRRVGAFVLAASAALGMILELLQVLSPTRLGSWADVWAQLLGASIGLLAWRVLGPAGVRWRRGTVRETDPIAFVARLLPLYLPIYLSLQLIPLGEATRRSEQVIQSPVPIWFHFDYTFHDFRAFAATALVTAPVGALAVLGWGRRRPERRLAAALALGAALSVAVEIGQGFLAWGHATLPDIVAAVIGVAIGAVTGDDFSRLRTPAVPPAGRWVRRAAIGAWLLALVAQYWQPFHVHGGREFLTTRLHEVQWIPFAYYYPAYASAPLRALHEIVRRSLAGVPLGVLLRLPASGIEPVADSRRRALITLGTAAAVFTGIELGQVLLPTRYPDVTDVLLGVTGALVGSGAVAALARRCRACATSAGPAGIAAVAIASARFDTPE
jgi:glycopeptide antibiotics resistance protein